MKGKEIGMLDNKQSRSDAQKRAPMNKREKALYIAGIVLCVILVPILVLNSILIVRSMIHPDEVPSIGKYVPLIVLTESMDPEIQSGDLILCERVDCEDLNVGDVISYFDPKSSGTTVITHRIAEKIVDSETGEIVFRTAGDNNNLPDSWDVPAKNVIGRWIEGARFFWVGSIILFMQSTLGLIVCVLVPIAVFVTIEILRRRKRDGEQQSDIDRLRAELETLKAAKAAEQTIGADVSAEEPPEPKNETQSEE
jgi:signal peptidase